jgi:intein/homing endonuclease
LNLTLQSGEELVVTPEHPLFTAHNAMISSVEAQELMPGMHIATPRSLTPQNFSSMRETMEKKQSTK